MYHCHFGKRRRDGNAVSHAMIFTFRIGNWGDRAKLKVGATRWQRAYGTRRKQEARWRAGWQRTQRPRKHARTQGQEDERAGSGRKAGRAQSTSARKATRPALPRQHTEGKEEGGLRRKRGPEGMEVAQVREARPARGRASESRRIRAPPDALPPVRTTNAKSRETRAEGGPPATR